MKALNLSLFGAGLLRLINRSQTNMHSYILIYEHPLRVHGALCVRPYRTLHKSRAITSWQDIQRHKVCICNTERVQVTPIMASINMTGDIILPAAAKWLLHLKGLMPLARAPQIPPGLANTPSEATCFRWAAMQKTRHIRKCTICSERPVMHARSPAALLYLVTVSSYKAGHTG